MKKKHEKEKRRVIFFLHKLTESESSRHWIALCRDNIYYFDSYGKPAYEPQNGTLKI